MNNQFKPLPNIRIGPQRVNELSAKLTLVKSKGEELGSLFKKLKGLTPAEALSVPVVSDHDAILKIRQDIDQTLLDYSKKYGRRHPLMIQARNES